MTNHLKKLHSIRQGIVANGVKGLRTYLPLEVTHTLNSSRYRSPYVDRTSSPAASQSFFTVPSSIASFRIGVLREREMEREGVSLRVVLPVLLHCALQYRLVQNRRAVREGGREGGRECYCVLTSQQGCARIKFLGMTRL